MPRIWVPTNELAASGGPAPGAGAAAAEAPQAAETIRLDGGAHRYLSRVLRVAVGAAVDVFDGRGHEATTAVERVGKSEVILRVVERRTVERRATPPVTLLQGLPRAERMDLVVQKAAELGAARLVPVRAARSASGQQARSDRWDRIAREAARQSGRAELLEISPLVSVEAAVAAEQAALAAGGVGIVPWEEAPGAPPLPSLVPPAPASVTVLIGPEGGLTSEEVAAATAAGFQVATLGPRILRTETAAIAALAVIQSRVGGLG